MLVFEFRRVGAPDIDYCWSLYSESMQPLALELKAWNETRQRRAIDEVLHEEGASILITEDSDAGWLYVTETRFDIHLGHFYLAQDRRGRGLGSGFLDWMGERARRKSKLLSVDVMKNSRARGLYERLGYRATATSGVTLRMELGR